MIKTILNTLHDSIACLTFVALGYITAFFFFVPFFTYLPNWQCIFAFPFLMFAIMTGFWLNSRG
jgi:hypothetical protein